jgi:hypothetical protein
MIRALRKLPARWTRMIHAGQSGQAMVESSVLLATLLGGLAVGGGLLMRYHPQMMNVLDIYMKGFYFTYSLPFP